MSTDAEPGGKPSGTLEEVASVRVLYVDTDQMGVVNNVHYLRWFEVGRAEWIRARGKTYRDLEKTGLIMPVVEAHVRYRSPARYDDLILVHAGPQAATGATITFGYALYVQDEGGARRRIAEGWTRHASTDHKGRARRFPAEVLQILGFTEKES